MVPKRRARSCTFAHVAKRVLPWIAVLVFSAWFFSLEASHDRAWSPEQSRLARASIDGDRVHLENVRSFRWRSGTEADERWVARDVQLSDVDGLDVIVSSWGWTSLVHTMVSFTMREGDPVTISIESRREIGEPFDPIRGALRQYEILDVVADEEDLFTLRAVHRGERLWLYRTSTSPDLSQRLLRHYLEEIESIADTPAFYDSFSRNCSTATRAHVAAVGVEDTWDWRVVLNGHVDELLYERGLLDHTRPLEQLRRESEITERVRELAGEPAFSVRLREALPEP